MELDFNQTDFSKLLFPIMGMPKDVDPVKQFPLLARYIEFNNTGIPKAKKNKLFRYIVLMYDKGSPFIQKIPDLYKRKIEVAKYADLISDPKNVDEPTKAILRNEDEAVNKMIVAYCRMQSNPLWTLVVGLNEKFYTEFALTIQKDDKKISMSNTMSELQEATQKLLMQDNSTQLLKDMFDVIEEERIYDLRPEGIADIFAAGKKPFEGEDVNYSNGTY